ELEGGINAQINQHRADNVATENSLLLPDHRLKTEYRYNSLNQLAWQKTPDGGETRFAYDLLGRIIASQNAKQATNNRFSYTTYDELGRIAEAGELALNVAVEIDGISGKLLYSANGARVETATAYPANISDYQYEVTRTRYTEPVSFAAEIFDTVDGSGSHVGNSRNRVTAIYSYDQVTPGTLEHQYNNAIFYNYDIHGNVKELVQHNKMLSRTSADPNSGMKNVLYEYDLISGNVNKVTYQKGKEDQFIHKY